MMTREQFQSAMIDTVRALFSEQEDLAPMLVALTENGPVLVPPDFRSEASKSAFAADARMAMRMIGATMCAFVAESWFVKLEPHEADWQGAPSEHPRRREGVLISIEEKGQPVTALRAEIERSNGRRVLGEFLPLVSTEDGSAAFTGRFSRFLGDEEEETTKGWSA